MARRYGISDETVRKWRKRGEHAVQDRSSRPKRLPWRVTEEEQAIICAVRRAAGFPLDDLTFVLHHFLSHLNRDNIYRVLKAEGPNRRWSFGGFLRFSSRRRPAMRSWRVLAVKNSPSCYLQSRAPLRANWRKS